MTIPLVVQGLVETEDGEVFGLDTCKGLAWLEVNDSFRYERIGAKKGYTARKETKMGGDYWYGYRKVAGKLHKRYIGKTAELSIAKLDEIAEVLDIPQQSRVIDKAREMETVQFELETLKQELANARADYIKLLESSIHITSKLRQEVQGLLVELEVQTTSCDELREELKDKELVCVQLQSQLETERSDQEEIEAKLSELKQNSAPAATVSEKSTADAGTILSQLRAKRKKSPVSLADIEAILEIIEKS
jgi:chromosome segregation ATPase